MSTPQSQVPANAPAINGWQAEFLDAQYQQFRADPNSLPADTRAFFQGLELGLNTTAPAPSGGVSPFEARVAQLINAYRTHGHLVADVDPLSSKRPFADVLNLAAYGLSDADLDKPVATGGTLRQLVDNLRAIYCGTSGIEFMHMPEPAERQWFIDRLERNPLQLTTDDKKAALKDVTVAETFERWLGKRYQGKKRFSLEGGESLIPMLKFMTNRAGEFGLREVVIGMAHRGRLNVLRHYLGKETERIITEFEDSWSQDLDKGGGDVKYHRGYSFDQSTPFGPVHISMLNNPSHLESVNPVVTGRTRARQDNARAQGRDGQNEIVALLIHGDAAVIGQGVVAECVNMSYLEGYHVGGTLHVVINNQIGFTTDVSDDRSSEYCTDVAKITSCPVIHVNGDDPEACVKAAILAIDYRHAFKKDIWVDLVCFRRHGHNEQDEPGYTQPEMYAAIKAHPGTRAVYAQRLADAGLVTPDQAQALVDAETAVLDKAQESAKAHPVNPVSPPGSGAWAGFVGGYSFDTPDTSITPANLAAICNAMGSAPEGFNVHPKLKGLLDARRAIPTNKKLSHADAEQIAFGSLLIEGTPIRLSGQDCRRGTFSQRHAVLRDEKTNVRYTPLNNIKQGQALLDVWDSPLSEYAIMGFEYGYSRANPRALVMWEGQFGDFCNTAQVIIDQFMAASEVKWDRWGGLVLLLPHGYEGQGPEHSSARLERFLQLCADNNMEVIYPSTGAQLFHALRRHIKRNFRKPLIVMTPKKYLRTETATADELLSGRFQHLIDDPTISNPAKVSKVLYCSGKFYHELHERRVALGKSDLAIVRVEQLYPFHAELAKAIDARYPASASRHWVQEEHRNQGAFLYAADAFRERAGITLTYLGRDASASPATGSEYAHKKQQEKIIAKAVGPLEGTGDHAHAPAPTPNGSPSHAPLQPSKPAEPAKSKSPAKVGR